MSSQIGFSSQQSGWDDLKELVFDIESVHTKTVRYLSQLKKRKFDLYLPSFILLEITGNKDAPKKIIVYIGKTPRPTETIGFKPYKISPLITTDYCEYDFVKKKTNSILYRMRYQNQDYSLYVPNEIFGVVLPPKRLFIRVSVPPSDEEVAKNKK